MENNLTPYEHQLVNDAEILLAKTRIIQKVYAMFGELSDTYQQLAAGFTSDILLANPKIARGENYEGLPYVMLDYPRAFGKTDVFAIRTFFWWGHFFSITLQLAGLYQQQFYKQLEYYIQNGLLNEWFITTSNNAWQHRFNEDYYKKVDAGKQYALKELAFIKVAKKIPLDKWDEAPQFLADNYNVICKMLCS